MGLLIVMTCLLYASYDTILLACVMIVQGGLMNAVLRTSRWLSDLDVVDLELFFGYMGGLFSICFKQNSGAL